METFGWLHRLFEKPAAGSNPLAGKPLRYLIGADDPGEGSDNTITEVGYDSRPVKRGISIGYCNLFDEKNTGRFGPYLHSSDTADEYHEGQIDPRGAGWSRNLETQFGRRKDQGFEFIELDNPDAYRIETVLAAIDKAGKEYGLKVVAKNPGLMGIEAATKFIAHPNVYGIIAEKDAGEPGWYNGARSRAAKPLLPIWFVYFGSGLKFAEKAGRVAKLFPEMRVTYSDRGEYETSKDIQ